MILSVGTSITTLRRVLTGSKSKPTGKSGHGKKDYCLESISAQSLEGREVKHVIYNGDGSATVIPHPASKLDGEKKTSVGLSMRCKDSIYVAHGKSAGKFNIGKGKKLEATASVGLSLRSKDSIYVAHGKTSGRRQNASDLKREKKRHKSDKKSKRANDAAKVFRSQSLCKADSKDGQKKVKNAVKTTQQKRRCSAFELQSKSMYTIALTDDALDGDDQEDEAGLESMASSRREPQFDTQQKIEGTVERNESPAQDVRVSVQRQRLQRSSSETGLEKKSSCLSRGTLTRSSSQVPASPPCKIAASPCMSAYRHHRRRLSVGQSPTGSLDSFINTPLGLGAWSPAPFSGVTVGRAQFRTAEKQSPARQSSYSNDDRQFAQPISAMSLHSSNSTESLNTCSDNSSSATLNSFIGSRSTPFTSSNATAVSVRDPGLVPESPYPGLRRRSAKQTAQQSFSPLPSARSLFEGSSNGGAQWAVAPVVQRTNSFSAAEEQSRRRGSHSISVIDRILAGEYATEDTDDWLAASNPNTPAVQRRLSYSGSTVTLQEAQLAMRAPGLNRSLSYSDKVVGPRTKSILKPLKTCTCECSQSVSDLYRNPPPRIRFNPQPEIATTYTPSQYDRTSNRRAIPTRESQNLIYAELMAYKFEMPCHEASMHNLNVHLSKARGRQRQKQLEILADIGFQSIPNAANMSF